MSQLPPYLSGRSSASACKRIHFEFHRLFYRRNPFSALFRLPRAHKPTSIMSTFLRKLGPAPIKYWGPRNMQVMKNWWVNGGFVEFWVELGFPFQGSHGCRVRYNGRYGVFMDDGVAGGFKICTRIWKQVWWAAGFVDLSVVWSRSDEFYFMELNSSKRVLQNDLGEQEDTIAHEI